MCRRYVFSPLSPRQLLSLHVDSLNLIVLNLLLPESLWHMTSTAITLLLDHHCKRYKTSLASRYVWEYSSVLCRSHVIPQSIITLKRKRSLSVFLTRVISATEVHGDLDWGGKKKAGVFLLMSNLNFVLKIIKDLC